MILKLGGKGFRNIWNITGAVGFVRSEVKFIIISLYSGFFISGVLNLLTLKKIKIKKTTIRDFIFA